ncbi:MAG: hypothetical protein KDA53_14670 [Hyphomonas sp.]|nr:hypothetical protein [Hyphomonas sp.]
MRPSRVRARTVAGLCALLSLAGCAAAPDPDFDKVLVIGDSMALGMGAGASGPDCELTLEQTARPYLAYGALVANAYAAVPQVEAVPGIGLVRNYDGKFGATLQERLGAPEYRGLPPRSDAPKLVILHVGTNDFQDFDAGEAFEIAYAELAGHVLSTYPGVDLVAMIGPMLDDDSRALAGDRIQAALARLPAKDAARVHYIAFESGELGDDAVGCSWRPTVSAHRRMADRILQTLQEN